MNKAQMPQLGKTNVSGCTSWDEWLQITESELVELEFKKYNQNLKNEDYAYWQPFYINGKKVYQIGIFFYDFRKHQQRFNIPERISIQFECMLIDIEGRIDLSVSDNISLDTFTKMAKSFYDAMSLYSH
jgi:hypothetical protein